MLRLNVTARIPAELVDPGLAEAALAAEIRRVVNDVAAELEQKLRGATIPFTGTTKRAWRRELANRAGSRFSASVTNPEIPARILESGATFPGQKPPIQSPSAGQGRTILDWVQQTDPVLVAELEARIQASRSRRGGTNSALGAYQLASRKAAHAVSGAIKKRGLPSSHNRNQLGAFQREVERGQALIEALIPAAIDKVFQSFGTREFRF